MISPWLFIIHINGVVREVNATMLCMRSYSFTGELGKIISVGGRIWMRVYHEEFE